MKKNIKILLLLLIVAILALGLKFWMNISPIRVDDSSSGLDPEIELAFDFAFALQYNDPDAYNLIDPSLKPRLDKWMSNHPSNECDGEYDVTLIGTGTNQGRKTIFGCPGYETWISFEVDDIVIKDMKVIDWGDVREGD